MSGESAKVLPEKFNPKQTILAISLGLIALGACAWQLRTSPASQAGREQRQAFVHSEEIQNPGALKRGDKVRVRPDAVVPHGREPREMAVRLPEATPFVAGSPQELAYLKGYALGCFDAVFKRAICRSHAGDRLKMGWDQGWSDGQARAAKSF